MRPSPADPVKPLTLANLHEPRKFGLPRNASAITDQAHRQFRKHVASGKADAVAQEATQELEQILTAGLPMIGSLAPSPHIDTARLASIAWALSDSLSVCAPSPQIFQELGKLLHSMKQGLLHVRKDVDMPAAECGTSEHHEAHVQRCWAVYVVFHEKYRPLILNIMGTTSQGVPKLAMVFGIMRHCAISIAMSGGEQVDQLSSSSSTSIYID